MIFSHKIDRSASEHGLAVCLASKGCTLLSPWQHRDSGKISGGYTGDRPMLLGTAQQLRDFGLHGFQFVQTQLRVRHNEDVAS